MYRKNFKPQIFTDITTPVKQFYSPDTGKIYVLFMIRVRNLRFSEIEGSGNISGIFSYRDLPLNLGNPS